MSAAEQLIVDTILDAIDRGPRRCRDCLLVINLCECHEQCDDPECECQAQDDAETVRADSLGYL